MRLTAKLLLALTLAALLILGVNALIHVRRDLALIDEDMRRDDAMIGRILGRAIVDAWAAGGEPAAKAIIKDTDLSPRHLRLRWVWLDAPVDPAVDRALLNETRAGADVAQRFIGNELVTLIPLELPDGRLAAIELGEPLIWRDRHIKETIRQALVTTGSLIVTLTTASLLIGFVFIGRPTRALVDKARRMAAGDLTSPLDVRQRDELGDLARELNGMGAQLAVARDRVSAEADARIAAVEQLRHADRLNTVGRLASGVAHELGTPLNVITGRAQMIAGGEVEGTELTDNARIIHEQALRMTAILRQLLDFARRDELVAERVPLRGVAQRCLGMIEATARGRDVEVRLADDADDVAAWVDDRQLQQAVLNLIVNAVHATPRGGRVEVDAAIVDATPPADHGGAAGRWARLRVIDTGAGMDEATRQRIFEPFFTTKPIGEGTGLGLSVTYGILRDAGGWIDVDSTPGAGSVFSLMLPLAPDRAA